jgi:hypothetical protein
MNQRAQELHLASHVSTPSRARFVHHPDELIRGGRKDYSGSFGPTDAPNSAHFGSYEAALLFQSRRAGSRTGRGASSYRRE